MANAITTVEPVPGTVSIFFNQGDGTFQHAGDYPAGTGVGHLTAITLAAGQVSSLAVTNYVSLQGANAVSILRNRGNGTFQLPVSYNTGKGPSWIATADFDHDGIPDLAVVNDADNMVSILLGKADGSFADKIDYPVAFGPSQLAIGDFNKDHIPDIVVTAGAGAKGGGAVSLLLGKGDGSFQGL